MISGIQLIQHLSDAVDSLAADGRWQRYKVTILPGEQGDWRVARFRISPEEAILDAIRAYYEEHDRYIVPGNYTGLWREGREPPVMSDTPHEILDHLPLFEHAHGHVLIHGLGLGMAACGVLASPFVNHVTVVEIEQDVIDLVGGQLLRRYPDRLDIVHDDCRDRVLKNDDYWNLIWHDLWDDLDPENIEEMHALQERYAPHCGDQACWSLAPMIARMKKEGLLAS